MPDRLTRLSNLALSRVAFVGSGDNPGADLVLWKASDDELWFGLVTKRTFTRARRVELAKAGAAIPVKNEAGEIVDGRYPIENVADLKNAMRAIGRVAAGDRAQVVAHIRKRARALGATDQLGDAFKGRTDVEKEPRLTESRMQAIREARDRLSALLGDGKGDHVPEDKTTEKGTEKKLPDDVSDDVRKLFEEVEAERDAARSEADKLKAEAEKSKGEPDQDEDPIAKALADQDIDENVRTILKAEHDRAVAAEQTARETAEAFAKSQDERADAEAVEKIGKLGKLGLEAEKAGPALRRFAKAEPEAAAEVERVLRATDAQIREHMLELGKAEGDEAGATAKFDARAAEIAKERSITKQQAYAELAQTPEGKDLMREDLREKEEV